MQGKLAVSAFFIWSQKEEFMPDEKNKPAPKMVPLSDLLALKATFSQKEKKWDAERLQLSNTVAQLQRENKVLRTDSDTEIDEVRQALLKQDQELTGKRTKYDEDLSAFLTQQKALRARELVLDLKSKGVEVETDSLLAEDDMERAALSLHADFLAKENERLKTQPPPGSPESVFESGNGSVIKKTVKDMSDADFDAHWKSLNRQAVAAK